MYILYTNSDRFFLGRKIDTDTRISKARPYRVDTQWVTRKYPPPPDRDRVMPPAVVGLQIRIIRKPQLDVVENTLPYALHG